MFARHTLESVVQQLVAGFEDGSVTYPDGWAATTDQEFEAQVPVEAFPGLTLKAGGVMIRGNASPTGDVRFSVGPVGGDTWEERAVSVVPGREWTDTFGPIGVGVTTTRATDRINLRVRVWPVGPSSVPAATS